MGEFIYIYQELHTRISGIGSELVCLGPQGLLGWTLPEFIAESGHGHWTEWGGPETEGGHQHGHAQW